MIYIKHFWFFFLPGFLSDQTIEGRQRQRQDRHWRQHEEDRTLRTKHSMQGKKVRQIERWKDFFQTKK